ncbi:uncharacterized protein DFL_003070 [Arthrobotrys flagrans]|uniref:Uncharacterized protein n=1 Tax=Arthrobotrys flagrans TaxID=97331 RepID=A0A437ADM7_ARTFL|nr:hypothetical protein DFL_003070 [Arthrobotrys flagrans]
MKHIVPPLKEPMTLRAEETTTLDAEEPGLPKTGQLLAAGEDEYNNHPHADSERALPSDDYSAQWPDFSTESDHDDNDLLLDIGGYLFNDKLYDHQTPCFFKFRLKSDWKSTNILSEGIISGREKLAGGIVQDPKTKNRMLTDIDLQLSSASANMTRQWRLGFINTWRMESSVKTSSQSTNLSAKSATMERTFCFVIPNACSADESNTKGSISASYEPVRKSTTRLNMFTYEIQPSFFAHQVSSTPSSRASVQFN